ncbi:hypothetical protein D3C87_2128860 [compost metagenome]
MAEKTTLKVESNSAMAWGVKTTGKRPLIICLEPRRLTAWRAAASATALTSSVAKSRVACASKATLFSAPSVAMG